MITPLFTYDAWQGFNRYHFEVMEQRVQIGLRRANRAIAKAGLPTFTRATSDHRPRPGIRAYCFASSAEHYPNPKDPKADCHFINADGVDGEWCAWGVKDGEMWEACGKVSKADAKKAHQKAQVAA